MREFAYLLDQLVLTPSRTGKIDALKAYLAEREDPERGWALAALTGTLDLKSIKPAGLRALVSERVDAELFALSYDFVGDLAETIALIWPERPGPSGANRPPEITEIVETLDGLTRAEAMAQVTIWLDQLDADGRWAMLKLVTGGLRVGVSARLAKLALAKLGGVDVTEIEEVWPGLAPPYIPLFKWLTGKGVRPTTDHPAPFRPVMLAHPLIEKSDRDNPLETRLQDITPEDFAAEWKWDGIRVQTVSDRGMRRLYTRKGDDISHTFPDVLAAMEFEGAIDGELLVRRADGGVADFNALQQRLNRKTVTAKQMREAPAFVRAYDLLAIDGADLRGEPWTVRRAALEALITALGSDRFDLSQTLSFTGPEALLAMREAPPHREIEGLMLKRKGSPYLVGRPVGHWYKWKRDPYLVDAVILYAQRGHGRRSSLYSDFTFGVWRNVDGEEALTPVGKAYFGFTDEELKRLDQFVRANTVDRFGPVRVVRADATFGLVVEVAFEGLQRSPRHKSGLAMRFPRIHRIRWDKPSAEADRIETLQALL